MAFPRVKLDGTNRSLRQLYAAFNRAYFDNKLDSGVSAVFGKNPKVQWMGCYVAEFETIYVNPVLRRFRRITCLVMMHEMVHVANPGAGHGRKFQQAMHALAEAGAFEQLW